MTKKQHSSAFRGKSRFAPSQCEMSLLCNGVSHWLCASLESALAFMTQWLRQNINQSLNSQKTPHARPHKWVLGCPWQNQNLIYSKCHYNMVYVLKYLHNRHLKDCSVIPSLDDWASGKFWFLPAQVLTSVMTSFSGSPQKFTDKFSPVLKGYSRLSCHGMYPKPPLLKPWITLKR